MTREFLILSVVAGPTLNQLDIDGTMDAASIIKEKKVRRVTLCYASNMDTEQIKEITKIVEEIAPKAIIVNLGGISCLNKKPAGVFGCNEAIKAIHSAKNAVVLLVVDTTIRNTKEDPIPTFLEKFSETETEEVEVLLDVKPDFVSKVANTQTAPSFIEAEEN